MRPVSKLISTGSTTACRVERDEPDDRALGVVRRGDQLDLDRPRLALAGPLDLQLPRCRRARCRPAGRRGRRRSPAGRRRRRSACRPGSSTSSAGAERAHSPSSATSRQTSSATTTSPGTMAASSRPIACHATYWATCDDVRIIWSAISRRCVRVVSAVALLAGEERDLGLVPPDPPRQHRLRRLGDGDEVDVAGALLVDLDEVVELTERHPVVDRLRRRRHTGVRGRLDDRGLGIGGIGDLLVGDQARTAAAP